jgi:glycosyltransferase involved in cell wall biosynthesis
MERIAIVSEHASPLALAGSVDSGGQNVYVAQIARHFAAAGCQVDVFTRRDDVESAEVVRWGGNIRIIHVSAGPPTALPKEQLLPYMGEFGAHLYRYFGPSGVGYDVVHANFFMSALAALPAARRNRIPLAVTFHALGRVRRLHQGQADQFPNTRFEIEDYIVKQADRIIAECPQDRQDLLELYGADPRRVEIVPCGYDAAEMGPMDIQAARAELGCDNRTFRVLQLGRMVPRKGIDNVIRAFALLRQMHGVEARLGVVGGESEQPCEQSTPELARLHWRPGWPSWLAIKIFVGAWARRALVVPADCLPGKG